MKKLYTLLLLILIFLLIACTKEDEMLIKPNSDSKIEDLVTVEYNATELNELLGFSGKMEDLAKKYQVECLREERNGYRVVFCGNEKVVILYFDSSMDSIGGQIFSTKKTLSEYEKLQGGTLSDVRNLDPYGSYPFLYAGRNDLPLVSFHCTNDGYYVSITYENEKVKDVKAELL